MRLRTGDGVVVVDSAATTFDARLEIDGKRVRAVLESQIASAPDRGFALTVAQGIPKAQKMDFVVEKLTELGVDTIVPLVSERAVAGATPAKLDRWQRLAHAAAQQSGRVAIPRIEEPASLEHVIARFGEYDAIVIAWEHAQAGSARRSFEDALHGARNVLVLIGPEGGFSDEEAHRAQAAGASVVWLGPRICRTETAGLVAAAFVNFVLEG